MSMSMQRQMMIRQNKEHELYICGSCSREPMKPVVTECGHIFWYNIWRCLYTRETEVCPVCGCVIGVEKCYPIFIQHEEEESMGQENQPARPSPNYRDKIINPGVGNSTLPAGLTHIQNNLQFGRQTPGPSYIPPMFVNSFNQIERPKGMERDGKIFGVCRVASYVLGVLFVVAVLFVVI